MRVGCSQGTLSELEWDGESSGLTPQFADLYGVSAKWLATGLGDKHSKSVAQEIDLENNADYPSIRKVRLTVSAGISGYGVEPNDDDDSIMVFRAEWYKSRGLIPDKCLGIRVSGQSMEPKLHHGDTVVINTLDTDLKEGKVYAFNLDGEAVIKRAFKNNGQWWLYSDNADKARFPNKTCGTGSCFPLGRVVHAQTEEL